MSVTGRDLRGIKTFPSLIKYLRDELDWPIETDDFDDLTFDYEPEELGIDFKTAAKIEGIKQLRPLVSNQPWGIFFVKFEPKGLPVVALRRILRSLVVKKRQSAAKASQASWHLSDLLFISAYGEGDERQITFAYFGGAEGSSDLPVLRVLGWDDADTVLYLDHVHKELHDNLRWPDNEADLGSWREKWSSVFVLRHGEVITTSKQLAIRLAEVARAIRKRVNAVLLVETETGPLRTLMEAFKEALIHDLDDDDFADMYAQTISYGLLSARLAEPSEVTTDKLAQTAPITNPFLRELLDSFVKVGGEKTVIDFDELGITEVVDLLREAKMEAVLRDFDNRNPLEDPVIHFYELFLKEYDSKKRMQRGVFYTPKPVVSFIVRSVDETLRREFGLEDGLADTTTWAEMVDKLPDFDLPDHATPEDPFVQILDPATGTGTFLVEVIDLIYSTMTRKWSSHGNTESELTELWNNYVAKHLLPRIYGFELLMAPYSIAHLKIGLKLYETGYSFDSHEHVQVFLTNSLEPPQDASSQLQMFAPALAREAELASKVKDEVPITVVIGNPPYSGHSANEGEWIKALLHGKLPDSADSYFKIDGEKLAERNPKYLNDDYVKFIRYGQSRIAESGLGVLGFITNHAYFDNPTFRGMRQSLTKSFDKLFLVNLHGNIQRKERSPDGSKDENVFDIRQGVAIGLFIRSMAPKNSQAASYADLWGIRQTKFQWLVKHKVTATPWEKLSPVSPFYLFIPQDTSLLPEYTAQRKITDIMPVNSTGIKTHRDHFVLDFDFPPLQERIGNFRDIEVPDQEIRIKYKLRDTGAWSLTEQRRAFARIEDWRNYFTRCVYRPFDLRYYYHHPDLVDRPREEVMGHFLEHRNLGVVFMRQVALSDAYSHFLVTNKPVDNRAFYSNKGTMALAPLYLYRSQPAFQDRLSTEVNLDDTFISQLTTNLHTRWVKDGCGDLKKTIGPEDVLHYIYAQFNSLKYRDRYAEFLTIDFPRVFLTANLALFRSLCQQGADLAALHLLEDNYQAASWYQNSGSDCPFAKPITTFADHNGTAVGKSMPKYKDGKVYINKESYFDGVPEEVWNFHIGGYQVCRKWLKDRSPKKGNPGRVLAQEDIAHYQKIVVALNETIRLMKEIDEVIEKHGGWPDAFVTNDQQEA